MPPTEKVTVSPDRYLNSPFSLVTPEPVAVSYFSPIVGPANTPVRSSPLPVWADKPHANPKMSATLASTFVHVVIDLSPKGYFPFSTFILAQNCMPAPL